MVNENQVPTGDSGSEPSQTTPQPQVLPSEPIPVAPTAKVEVKDGRVVVDGKKFVAESDLIAAKNSLDGQLKQQQAAHEQAIDKAKLDMSEAQQQIAQLNAKSQENEHARQSGAATDEEAAKVKQDLETAWGSMERLTSTALEYRRALLVLQYGIAPDTIKEKDMTQLDSFEEAVKAVSTSRGSNVGPYAVGVGGVEAAPQTAMERAAKVLESTPIRGVRTAEAEK